MPRLMSMGLAPAATFLRPTLMIDWASTVAVVVPSPASSPVFEATSLTSCAPMFWNGSSSSTSRATLTPSLVMWGAPNFFSMITLRPLGPRVTFTASARASTPFFSSSRAFMSNFISFAMVGVNFQWWGIDVLFLNHCENIALTHDEIFCAIEFNLGAGIFAEEYLVAGLYDHFLVLGA